MPPTTGVLNIKMFILKRLHCIVQTRIVGLEAIHYKKHIMNVSTSLLYGVIIYIYSLRYDSLKVISYISTYCLLATVAATLQGFMNDMHYSNSKI